MSPFEVAHQSVHQLDILELAHLRATVAARIDSLTGNQITPGSNRVWRWLQRVTQPHHYARARERENQSLRSQIRKLNRELLELRRRKGG